jgi:hypothetical protein
MTKPEILKQVEELKTAMTNALDIRGDVDKMFKLEESEFIFSFKDATTGKTYNITVFPCPEVWELMEEIAEDIPRIIEDYD